MHTRDVIEQLGNANPARQNRDVGDERYVAHQFVARAPGIASEHFQFSFVGSESENRVERGGFAGAVWADDSENAAFFDAKIDIIQRDGCAVHFPQTPCFNCCHG